MSINFILFTHFQFSCARITGNFCQLSGANVTLYCIVWWDRNTVMMGQEHGNGCIRYPALWFKGAPFSLIITAFLITTTLSWWASNTLYTQHVLYVAHKGMLVSAWLTLKASATEIKSRPPPRWPCPCSAGTCQRLPAVRQAATLRTSLWSYSSLMLGTDACDFYRRHNSSNLASSCGPIPRWPQTMAMTATAMKMWKTNARYTVKLI